MMLIILDVPMQGKSPLLVMEFMEYGSLYDLLRNETIPFEISFILTILKDVTMVRVRHTLVH